MCRRINYFQARYILMTTQRRGAPFLWQNFVGKMRPLSLIIQKKSLIYFRAASSCWRGAAARSSPDGVPEWGKKKKTAVLNRTGETNLLGLRLFQRGNLRKSEENEGVRVLLKKRKISRIGKRFYKGKKKKKSDNEQLANLWADDRFTFREKVKKKVRRRSIFEMGVTSAKWHNTDFLISSLMYEE